MLHFITFQFCNIKYLNKYIFIDKHIEIYYIKILNIHLERLGTE